MDTSITIRPSFGRVVTVVVGIIAAAALGSLVISGGQEALRAGPFPLLLAYAAWLTLWRPHVRIADEGVTMRNVFTTVTVPWSAIQRIDTRWALTLYTPQGRHVAWAAPAPGRHAASRYGASDARNLPASAYDGASVRPSDLPRSDSGDAATIIRRRWEELAGASAASGAPAAGAEVSVRVHGVDIAVLVALVALAVASILL